MHGRAEEPQLVETGSVSISVEDLIARIHTASTAEFQNAVGYYVVRHYEKRDERKDAQALEDLRRFLEKTLQERIENDKKFGVITSADTIRQIRESNQQTLTAQEQRYKESVVTEVVRYTVEGSNYRIERIAVSNTDSLDKIRQDVLAGLIDLSTPQVLTWNGKVTAEIITNIDHGNKSSDKEVPHAMSSISYSQLAKLPEFMEHGRDLKNKKMFEQFIKQGLPINAASITLNGEQGLLLRVGHKNSVALTIDTCVLPSKGYAVTLGRVKVGGAVMGEDYYRDFVKVKDGSWLPTRITRTNYQIDSQGVLYVVTKKEMLAIEPPNLNIKLPENVFNLANTKGFQALRPLNIEIDVGKGEMPKRLWTVVRWNFIIAGFILVVWALMRMWRTFRHNHLGIFVVSVLSLSTISGCQSDSSPMQSKKDAIVLTDSGVLVNFPSGTIPVMAPVGMGIKKEFTIKSECSSKIEAMTVSTTCGCSQAQLSCDAISPGESMTLALFFRGCLFSQVVIIAVFKHNSRHGDEDHCFA